MQLTIAPLLGVLEEPIQAFLPACLSVRLLCRNVRSVNAPDTDEFQGQQPAGYVIYENNCQTERKKE